MKYVAFVLAVLLALPAAAIEFSGQAVQGGLLVGRVASGSHVTVDGNPVRVSPQGEFLVGFGRDATAEVAVESTAPDGTMQTRRLAPAPRQWTIQRIDGLPPAQVTPDPEVLARIRAEADLLRDARAVDSPGPALRDGFIWPVVGPISGVFGSQRILNGEPRSPHNGVDIAAQSGSLIRAAADGTVALVHPDMYFAGQSLLIDHGHGLSSVYVHMSETLVKPGTAVKQGDPVGRVGATGRATGPHLHWGVALFLTHLDPALLAGPMPAARATEK